MAQFTKKFFDTIGNWEAGFQNDSNDKGNYDSKGRLIGTNRGCAAQTVETWYKKTKGKDLSIVPLKDFVTIMKALTYDDAFNIGKTLFWDAINCDLFKNQSIAEIIFDWYWASFAYGTQWLQGVLKAVFNMPVKVDFFLTPEEVNLINNYPDQKMLFYVIKDERLKYVEYLVKSDPSNRKYELGWLRRIISYSYEE